MFDPNRKKVMLSECDNIMKNDTWELIEKPTKQKVIGTKWVWKANYKVDGSLEMLKAILVAHKDTPKSKTLMYMKPLPR